MGGSANYISPSKKMRNLSRLSFYLKQKLIKMKQKSLELSSLSLTNLSSKSISPSQSQPSLSISTNSTNFPLPCQVCNLNECKYDLAHQLFFAVAKMEKSFEDFNRRNKPPEDKLEKLLSLARC